MFDFSFLGRAEWGKGCFVEDYIFLTGVVAMLQPRTILEVGTSYGLGSVVLAKAALQWQPAAMVTTIDVDTQHGHDNIGLVPGLERHIEFIQGHSDHVLAEMIGARRRFDLCFLDGDHSFVQARRDWAGIQRLSDIYILHDTTQHQGLQQLVETIRADPAFEVFQLVAAPGHRVKPRLTRENFITGMTLVQRRVVLSCLAAQAHRDFQGQLLPGHGETDVPNLSLLFP